MVADNAYIRVEASSRSEDKRAKQTAHRESNVKDDAYKLSGEVDVDNDFMYPALGTHISKQASACAVHGKYLGVQRLHQHCEHGQSRKHLRGRRPGPWGYHIDDAWGERPFFFFKQKTAYEITR